MKIELATAKIRNGAKGTWRSLKPGELIQEGDILFCMTWASDINRLNFGEPVRGKDAIIRLEFE